MQRKGGGAEPQSGHRPALHLGVRSAGQEGKPPMKPSPLFTALILAAILAAGILWSMWKTRAETRVDT